MITTAKVECYSGGLLIIRPDSPIEQDLTKKEVRTVEIRINDGRRITNEQRKKVYALIKEIADWCGDYVKESKGITNDIQLDFLFSYINESTPQSIKDDLKELLKYSYLSEMNGGNHFSLSNCSVDTARAFIDYLVEFCLKHDVPCRDNNLLSLTEDINRYLYHCLVYKKCCVTGQKAEFHHCTGSRVGMGRDRKEIAHLGAVGMALSRDKHMEIHNIGEAAFAEKYHVYGIKADEEICRVYKLKVGD